MHQRLEKLKLEIMNISNFDLAEIKSYQDPPPEVRRVMAATFMLIGDDPRKLKVRFV